MRQVVLWSLFYGGRKWDLAKVTWGHTAIEWWRRNSNSSHRSARPLLFLTDQLVFLYIPENQPPEQSSLLCATWENLLSVLLQFFEPELNIQGYKISSSLFFLTKALFLGFYFQILFFWYSHSIQNSFLYQNITFCTICFPSSDLVDFARTQDSYRQETGTEVTKSPPPPPGPAATKMLWSWVFLMSLLTMFSVHT